MVNMLFIWLFVFIHRYSIFLLILTEKKPRIIWQKWENGRLYNTNYFVLSFTTKYCHLFFVGYVDEIKKSLLNLSKEERKSVAEKYNTKVPEPLNSQFPERVNKSVAVDQNTQRKEREATKLYPVGKVPV